MDIAHYNKHDMPDWLIAWWQTWSIRSTVSIHLGISTQITQLASNFVCVSETIAGYAFRYKSPTYVSSLWRLNQNRAVWNISVLKGAVTTHFALTRYYLQYIEDNIKHMADIELNGITSCFIAATRSVFLWLVMKSLPCYKATVIYTTFEI